MAPAAAGGSTDVQQGIPSRSAAVAKSQTQTQLPPAAADAAASGMSRKRSVDDSDISRNNTHRADSDGEASGSDSSCNDVFEKTVPRMVSFRALMARWSASALAAHSAAAATAGGAGAEASVAAQATAAAAAAGDSRDAPAPEVGSATVQAAAADAAASGMSRKRSVDDSDISRNNRYRNSDAAPVAAASGEGRPASASAAADPTVPELGACDLVVGSRVEEERSDGTWHEGTIVKIEFNTLNTKTVEVQFSDGVKVYNEGKEGKPMPGLRPCHQEQQNPETHQWNILNHFLSNERMMAMPGILCPLTKDTLNLRVYQNMLIQIRQQTCNVRAAMPLIKRFLKMVAESNLQKLSACNRAEGANKDDAVDVEWSRCVLRFLSASALAAHPAAAATAGGAGAEASVAAQATAAAAAAAAGDSRDASAPPEVGSATVQADRRRSSAADSQNKSLTEAQIQFVLEFVSEGGFTPEECEWTQNNGFIIVPGEFRGTPAQLCIVTELDPEPHSNPALREIQARSRVAQTSDGAVFPTLMQFNEKFAQDLITVPLQGGGIAHAIILEAGLRPAAQLFDALALKCKESPLDPPADELGLLLQAMLELLKGIHGSGMAYLADFRNCSLSDMKNGHKKKAAAFLRDEKGQSKALLLGFATCSQHNNCKYHEKGCGQLSGQQRGQTGSQCSKRPKTDFARASMRLANHRDQLSEEEHSPEVKAVMKAEKASLAILGNDSGPTEPKKTEVFSAKKCACADGYKFGLKRAEDCVNVAHALINILCGRTGANDNPLWQPEEGSPIPRQLQLLAHCLASNPGLAMESPGCSQSEEDHLNAVFRGLGRIHRSLLFLISSMADSANDQYILAESLLSFGTLFDRLPSARREYPAGLESAPESERVELSKCAPLLQAIASKHLHYFVKGGIGTWRGGSVKLLSSWLVYTDKENGWQRSLVSAEIGRRGEHAAVYATRAVSTIEAAYLQETHLHQFPSCRGSRYFGFDGLPRGTGAEQKMIESWTMGSLIDSVKDEAGVCASRINCKREWEGNWQNFNRDKCVANPILSNRLAFILTADVGCYAPYLYPYDWKKIEERSKKPNIQRRLANESGVKRGWH